MDKVKGLVLTAVIGAPFASLLLHIIKTGGEYFYIYVWVFLFLFSIIMMTLVPVVIMPMFNKYEPLPEGTLKTRIFELADRLKYPLTKVSEVWSTPDSFDRLSCQQQVSHVC
jgi:STE24 endopeptidase